MINRVYGWVPDLPDHRDRKLLLARTDLPDSVDLRSGMPTVYDQGQLGSCTANALAAAIEFDHNRQGMEAFTPSRLFIYFNERLVERSTASDSGAMLRDGIKTLAKYGACPEPDWVYNTRLFCMRPPPLAYASASKHRIMEYLSLDRSTQILRTCLAAGFPFVFGFSVYEGFESAAVAHSGIAAMPASSEQMLGGHAVIAVGYDHIGRRFLCRNSWGVTWGLAGYFWLPYEYFMSPDLSDDFWTIRMTK